MCSSDSSAAVFGFGTIRLRCIGYPIRLHLGPSFVRIPMQHFRLAVVPNHLAVVAVPIRYYFLLIVPIHLAVVEVVPNLLAAAIPSLLLVEAVVPNLLAVVVAVPIHLAVAEVDPNLLLVVIPILLGYDDDVSVFFSF